MCILAAKGAAVIVRTAFIGVLTLALLLAPLPARPADGARPVVVWDAGRRGFDMKNVEEAEGVSRFAAVLRDAVDLRNAVPTAETLAGATSYVLYAPVLPIGDPDAAAIEAFVIGGGRCLLVVFEPMQLRPLLRRLGLTITRHHLRDETATVLGDSRAFYARAVGGLPLVAGIERVAVSTAPALKGPAGRTTVVLATSPNAYVDRNRNGVHDEPGPRIAAAVGIVVQWGKGQVLVLADEMILANQNFVPSLNRPLGERVAQWLAGAIP
jgi:hypothetical protein